MYNCNICKDVTLIIVKDANGNEYAKDCVCREKAISRRLMISSGISEDDAQKGFKGFNTFDEPLLVNAKNTAISYFKNFKSIEDERINSMMLCGKSGRGKTTLGLAIANNLIDKGVGVRYMPYRDVVTSLKQQLASDNKYFYNDQMYKLQNARVLFIDDLLKGKVNETDINIMYEVINYRYLKRKPVIISTEKTIEELLEFDEAIASRLIEMSKGYIVTFDDSIPNYRLR